MSVAETGILNVFEPGLKRGSAKLAFAPHKRYFYVEHPTEKWRVYLRAASFIHDKDEPFDAKKFLVVKKTNTAPSYKVWEPPKGQMEGKDAKPDGAPLLELMTENIKREIEEESKITKISKLRYTGLVVQSQEKDYPSNHYFQYHVFQVFVKPEIIDHAFDVFTHLRDNPKEFKELRSDKKEKDTLAWYDPSTTKLMGRWSPSIVALYLKHYIK